MRISLDTSLSPLGATIVTDGQEAWFDLAGLPRVDTQLTGRPAATVPPLVERLCGICPVPHHLAGLAALEALTGAAPLPETALATRRLLLYASTVDQLALRLAQVDISAVRPLRQAAKAAMTAAGSPGHFPTTGVPGGVRALPEAEALAEAAQVAQQALPVAERLVEALRPDAGAEARTQAGAEADACTRAATNAGAADTASQNAGGQQAALPPYTGLEVCLVDADDHPDLMGPFLRAVDAAGRGVLEGATPDQWRELVTESRPGSVAPRPLLHLPADPAGHPGHPYRVGPLAQLAVGSLTTPRASAHQQTWLTRRDQNGASGNLAAHARAIILLHALEVVADLTGQPHLFSGTVAAQAPTAAGAPAPAEAPATSQAPAASAEAPGTSQASATRTGTGWVESPRGLLVHSYTADPDGTLTAAQILTPTVQTEPWLADMLTSLAPALSQASAEASLPEEVRCAVEQAVQAADPCLPCVSAPAGSMGVSVRAA